MCIFHRFGAQAPWIPHTTIHGCGRASGGSVGEGQTIGGVSGRGSHPAESDQLGNHGSPACLPRREDISFLEIPPFRHSGGPADDHISKIGK